MKGKYMNKNKKISDEYDVTERLFDKLTVTYDDPNKDYKVTVKLPDKKKKNKVYNKLSEFAGYN